MLENDFDMEYCIDTLTSPLEVYVPLDISYDLYKEYAQNCINLLKDKPQTLSKWHDMELQNELVQIMQAIRDSIPQNVKEHYAE